MVCLIVKKMVVLLSNITEQSAVVPVDPFLGGIGNGHLVERSSSRSRRGKCVPWEFPLFSGWPRMPSVRMAELEGSWWLDIFPLSTPPPPLYFVSLHLCSTSSPSFLHSVLCSVTATVHDHPALVRLKYHAMQRAEYSNTLHYQRLIVSILVSNVVLQLKFFFENM